ncbi:PucR family transcriptional regulator [Rhodococcus sp. H29-C3]|uniref:PucR family transcriptional regulator n=1 Tax=Rhodococcus sp. H29-C3 TaxID=3046307 RepID=UPI0024B92A5A|nr:PucR family transcriptional regulator [Rhodococcus sp. H29-C3]MDJ0360156.1 helix-turn-helix domain-containing protein [Rhodococcus sp. H29-C3]
MDEDSRVELATLLDALPVAFVELVVSPAGGHTDIRSVALLDSSDLSDSAVADLALVVGASESGLLAWFDDLELARPHARPRAVMAKGVGDSVPIQHAARQCGIALIAVHPQTDWERLLSIVRGVLDHSLRCLDTDDVDEGRFGADTDLYGLARTVASLTKGMVSIEDERSHVLAYSASESAADELRTLSILGREGPADYLRTLTDWGVFERIRSSDDVLEVPAAPDLGIRRRLVVGIRSIPDASGTVVNLGSIWVQEGNRPLLEDADGVLTGAAAVAARLITRILDAPSNEAVQIQRLLGARGGGVDIPSLAAALSIPTSGPAAMIGFAAAGSRPVGEVAPAVRLHASAFHRLSLATTIGDRIYVLFPAITSVKAVESWTREVIVRIEERTGVALRAALTVPVASLTDVPAGRFEVDRVLDRTMGEHRVTSLAESRTSVLLGEIIELVSHHPQLLDSRMETLRSYDAKHSSAMVSSLAAYLSHFGEIRSAAAELGVHPNTLRYRITRVEQILGADLSDPDERMLMEIQLRLLPRRD